MMNKVYSKIKGHAKHANYNNYNNNNLKKGQVGLWRWRASFHQCPSTSPSQPLFLHTLLSFIISFKPTLLLPRGFCTTMSESASMHTKFHDVMEIFIIFTLFYFSLFNYQNLFLYIQICLHTKLYTNKMCVSFLIFSIC